MTNESKEQGWEEKVRLLIAQSAPFTFLKFWEDADFERLVDGIRGLLNDASSHGKVEGKVEGLEEAKEEMEIWAQDSEDVHNSDYQNLKYKLEQLIQKAKKED